MRIRRSYQAVIIVCALVCLCSSVIALVLNDRRSTLVDSSLGYRNLRALVRSLEAYRADHGGAYPHDGRGPDFALYLLKGYADSTVLACDRDAPAPAWDDNEHRVRNCGWAYLNIADTNQIAPEQVLLASQTNRRPAVIFFATRMGKVAADWFPCDASKAVLGSYATEDGFIVSSAEVFLKWRHFESYSARWNYRRTSGGVPIERFLQCGNQTIRDRFVTDDFGRVIEIVREPAEWESVWLQLGCGAMH